MAAAIFRAADGTGRVEGPGVLTRHRQNVIVSRSGNNR